MENLIGKTISHYRIEEQIGSGGMGTAYRAVDTRLNRTVALKVLPPDLLQDPDRRRRFSQEAKAASSLNHPNIVTIHDIGSENGVEFIVMEFVDGKTLEEEIGRRPLPLTPLLRIAVQIANALTAAHSVGVIHRDMKPTNVMVNKEGLVKVLDFGLAKLANPSAQQTGNVDTANRAETITIASEATQPGIVMGTAAYMSPEQGEGREIDARSDIFSFGSVLYEMATGRRAFHGPTAVSTIASVLRDEPKPISTQTAPLPHDLEKIVNRCLKKDPSRRFQHMADLKVALEELREDLESGKFMMPTSAPIKQRPSLRWPIAAAALAIASVAGGAWMYQKSTARPLAAPVTRLTFDTGFTAHPAISPDGKLMVYVSDRSSGKRNIWLQQLSNGQSVQLTKHQDDAMSPSFSPDGSLIVYSVVGKEKGIYVIPAIGGDPRRLAPEGRVPKFSPDGSLLSYIAPDSSGKRWLNVLPVGGGDSKQVANTEGAMAALWLPGGKNILYWGLQGDEKDPPYMRLDWYVAPMEGGPIVRTGVASALREQKVIKEFSTAPPPWALANEWIFFTATSQPGMPANIWRLRLDPKTFQPSGPAIQVTFGTEQEIDASVSLDGKLVYSSRQLVADYWNLPVIADEAKVTGTRTQLIRNSASDNGFLTSDGGKFLFCSVRGGNSDIWMRDTRTGQEASLLSTSAEEHVEAISADGSSLVLGVDEGRRKNYLLNLSGNQRKFLCENCGHMGLAPDGSRLVYITEPNHRSYTMLNLSSGKSTEFATVSEGGFSAAHFTPNGQWVLLFGRKSYLVPVRDSKVDQKEWVAFGDASRTYQYAAFSPKGAYLYYVSNEDGHSCVYAQRLDASMKPAGNPVVLQHLHEGTNSFSHPHGLSVGADKIVLLLNQGSNTIFMTRVPIAN